MVALATVPGATANPDWTYLPKEVRIVVKRNQRGIWGWLLRDYFGETAVMGRFIFKTRKAAEVESKAAKEAYVRKINERFNARKGQKTA
jgi:hypothetical protein